MTATPDFGAGPFALGRARGVAIRGELDLDVAPGVTALVDEAIRTTAGTFVVDLSGLRFLDSTGLTLFIRARALLGQEAGRSRSSARRARRAASSSPPASRTCSRSSGRARRPSPAASGCQSPRVGPSSRE